MANKTATVLQTGINNYLTPALAFNKVATDTLAPGIVGAYFNTSGVAPATGAFAVNAQGSPNMTVAVSAGSAYVQATPTSGTAQKVSVTMDASENVTIAANATGSTVYDFLYIKVDADKMNNPSATGLDAVTLVTQRSTTQTVDSNGALANGLLIAEITVSNGAVSISNANIQDRRLVCTSDITGWQQAQETWTYASATTITVPSGAAFKYSVGDKIRFIQSGSTKFMYVTGVADTLLTVNGGTDYTVANAAIGSPCYSKRVSPVGFPQWFAYTPTWTNLTVGAGTNTGRFNIIGRKVICTGRWVFGAGAAVGSNAIISLPVAASSNYSIGSNAQNIVGSMSITDSGAAYYGARPGINITSGLSGFQMLIEQASGTYVTFAGSSSTTPMTWTTNDEISWTINYEI